MLMWMPLSFRYRFHLDTTKSDSFTFDNWILLKTDLEQNGLSKLVLVKELLSQWEEEKHEITNEIVLHCMTYCDLVCSKKLTENEMGNVIARNLLFIDWLLEWEDKKDSWSRRKLYNQFLLESNQHIKSLLHNKYK